MSLLVTSLTLATASAVPGYAVRNTRVLARHAARFVRGGRPAPAALLEATHELGLAAWDLAAELDDPRGRTDVRVHASRAAALATASFDEIRELGLAKIVAQVRSTAIDLVRAEEAAGATGDQSGETPTEELLIELPPSGATAPA